MNIIINHKNQFLYSILVLLLCIIMYIINKNMYTIIPLFSISIGHILSPFLLTPNLYFHHTYNYDMPISSNP